MGCFHLSEDIGASCASKASSLADRTAVLQDVGTEPEQRGPLGGAKSPSPMGLLHFLPGSRGRVTLGFQGPLA